MSARQPALLFALILVLFPAGSQLIVADFSGASSRSSAPQLMQAGGGTGNRIAPGSYRVHVSLPDGSPAHAIPVRLGPRVAYTESDGAAVFDGVPEGEYAGAIRAKGYEFVNWTANLPAGERGDVSFQLVETKRIKVSGRITLGDSEEPACGVEVHMEPVEVAASLAGSIRFCTDWDGKFELHHVPGGLYRVTASPEGLHALDQELQVAPGMEPVNWSMQRVSEQATARIRVTDAEDQPIRGARVILAEAWPSGEFARAETGADGMAVFDRLLFGGVTRSEGDVSALLGERFGVRVEAEGYAPEARILRRTAQIEAGVTLQSTKETEESEPNNTGAEANTLRFGAPTSLKLDESGDLDLFRFNLRHEAELHIEVDLPAITTRLVIYEHGSQSVVDTWAYGNRTMEHDVSLPAGEYLLELSAKSRNSTCEDALTLRVDANWAPDLHEPNGEGSAGTPVLARQELHAFMLPAGEVDIYRMETQGAGVARFRIPKPAITTQVVARDRVGEELGSTWTYAGHDLVLEVHTLKAREIFLSVSARSRGDYSTTPYRIECDWIPADAPPASEFPESVRRLQPKALVGATNAPANDLDRWRVDLPSSGVLHVETIHPGTHRMRIVDAYGRVLEDGWSYGGHALTRAYSVPGPKTVFIEVSGRADNLWSASSYMLRTNFLPCDEHERTARNDGPDAATAVEAHEPVRGVLSPAGDLDLYRFVADFPGYLELEGACTGTWSLRIFDSRMNELKGAWSYARHSLKIGTEVAAGEYFLCAERRDPNDETTFAYSFRIRYDRAEPYEVTDLGADPVRQLALNEARSWAPDQGRDLDRFRIPVTRSGEYWIRVYAPDRTNIKVLDELSGEAIHDTWTYQGVWKKSVKAGGPTRYRIELSPRDAGNRTEKHGYVLVSDEDKPFANGWLSATPKTTDPTLVTFRCETAPRGEACAGFGIDVDRDGALDASTRGDSLQVRFADEGVFAVDYQLDHENGTVSSGRMWVVAMGPRERKGVHVRFAWPGENELIDSSTPCRAMGISYSGTNIRRMSLEVDGRFVAADHSAPYEFDVSWRELGPGEHKLRVTAQDAMGHTGTAERTVRVSPFFDLFPFDGAVITGDDIRVSWYAPEFGRSAVRYRAEGDEEWTTAEGDNGRERLVVLEELEPGRPYEFMPIDGDEEGPVRRFTRVKGLAFGKLRYGGNIKRDYDQRVGISVRNHADVPMTVRLECGEIHDSLLLAGFVGEGSEGEPFELQPGEERSFVLGLSAQDVVKEHHVFPIRIASESGYTDEAEVEVLVDLPEVKLEWEDAGEAEHGLGRRFFLINRGDTITDLDVVTDSPEMNVYPSMQHAMLKRGERVELTVRPKLSEGFSKAGCKLVATALARDTETDVEVALPDGEQMFLVKVQPGTAVGDDPEDYESTIMAARAMSGPYLVPGLVDWSARENPEDTDGDGRPDRWTVDDAIDRILWVGNDTTGDGEIDFVNADIGYDGVFEHSSIRGEDGWEPTNLVEAWLETSYSLPWARSKYEKHDLQVLMNGQVLGELKDTLPEGNFAFRIPPSAIDFAEDGTPKPGNIEIRTEHLRGGHYVVSNDFRLKFKLTGSQAWVSAADRAQAEERIRNMEGVSTDGTDYSVSSRDVEIIAPEGIEAGKQVTVRATLRSFGATGARSIPVALLRALPGREGVELAREWVYSEGTERTLTVDLPWTVAAGNHSLQVVVDPDGVLPETDRENNLAMAPLEVPGDDARPTMELNFEDGSTIDGTVLDIAPRLEDDSGIARVEARLDDGLWQPLESLQGGKALLQPGEHNVEVRAIDSSGNEVVKSARVTSNAERPQYEVLEPAGGAEINGRKADVALRTPPNAKLAAARVNGGPWKRLPIDENGTAAGTVPVDYGDAEIETMVVDENGARHSQTIPVRGNDRRSDEEVYPPSEEASDGVIDVPGFGEVDAFGPPNTLSAPPSTSRSSFDNNAGRRNLRPGTSVQVHQRQTSWYCTNRPKIGTTFQLPDWLRRKKLPLPGTKEFEEMERRLLEAMRAQGIDTSSLEKFQDALMRRIGMMEQPGELPGFLESLGLTESRPSGLDEVELDMWRDKMREKAQAWWIRLLASGDADLVAEGLKARARALGKYDEAMQDHAQAAIETIHANQKLTEDVASMIPYVGEAMDIVAAATGETLAGDKIGGWERLFRATMVLGPIGLEQYIKRSPRAQEALGKIVERASQLGAAGKRRLLEALGMTADDFGRAVGNMAEAVGKNKRKLAGTLDEAADSARIGWKHSPAGIEDARVWRQARETAEQRIKKLQDLIDPDTGKIFNKEGFERAMLEIQKDKLAQNLLNKAPGSHVNKAREAMKNQIEGVLYRDVDRAVNAALESSDEVQAIARKHGLKTKIDPTTGRHVPDGWSVETMNISNTGGAPKPVTTIGRDRDVTYQIIGKADNGRNIKVDIHHEVSRPTYAEEFYKRTHGGNLPDVENPALRQKLLNQNLDLHDQMVTSKWHPEAYDPGEVPLGDFLDRGVTPTLTRPEAIRDTFVFKSDHWFHRAKRYADNPAEYGKSIAEGMRQATKQWDNQVLPRLKQFGNLDKVPTIPPHLEKAVDIMRQVDDLKISPQQAEAMLAALPTPSRVKLTPESAVRQMGGFLEGMEKTAGTAYRKLGTRRLMDTLDAIPHAPGSNQWTQNSLEAVNSALRNGEISGETFVRQRANIISGRVQAAREAGTQQAWRGLDNWLNGIPEGKLLSPLERRALAKTVNEAVGE